MKIRFGFAPGPIADRATFVRVVDLLERLGFDSLWLPEVLTGPLLDPLTGLALAAGRTERLKLGTQLVTPGRQPVRLARETATVDRLSAGRLLLTFVPGIETPDELAALGVPRAERNRLLEESVVACRDLWHTGGLQPQQEPFEVWLAGQGPKALERAARLGDGWIPGFCSPEEAGEGRRTIIEHGVRLGRAISDEHFGYNIAYGRGEIPAAARARFGVRLDQRDVDNIVPTSAAALRSIIGRAIDQGLSKFVVRPLAPPDDWDRELGQLADDILALTT